MRVPVVYILIVDALLAFAVIVAIAVDWWRTRR